MSYAASGVGGYGMGLYGFGALGAVSFEGPALWSQFKAGGLSTATAAKTIQAALNQLGYGPLVVDGQLGSASTSAIARFQREHQLQATGWPDAPTLISLSEAVKAGGAPGGGQVVESHLVGQEFVPGAAPGAKAPAATARAGLSTGAMIGIGAAVLAGVAILAIAAKPKRSPQRPPPRPAPAPVS